MPMTPSAEAICVGTELLLGDILNSNAQFLARQLAELGIPHFFQTVVGDNRDRLREAITTAAKRSNLLIFTGGLGPTPDDLTVETIAAAFNTSLIEQPDAVADIERKLAQRGRPMTVSNRKQALIPQGATLLPNPIGTAPGIIWEPRPGVTILTFPGVPSEMKAMWRETAVPYLRDRGWSQGTIYSRTLRFWGVGESTLAEKVADFLDHENPTVAPYAGRGEVKLRISARAATEADAIAAIEPVERQLRHLGGRDCYGCDRDTLATVVGKLLSDRRETVAAAESCTAGGLGAMFTEVPGSSRYFLGGVMSYSNESKVTLLGVRAETLEKFGAVSAETACEMAQGARDRLGSDWGLSITGIAGPGGGTAEKPIGLVYVGLAGPDGRVESQQFRFGSQRERDWIRAVSACTALDVLRRRLLDERDRDRP